MKPCLNKLFFFLFYYPSISYQVFPIVKVKYQRKMAFGKTKQTKNPRTIETSSTLTPGDDCAQRLYVSLDLASVLI